MEKLNIVQETENPLFNRKEVYFELDSDMAPSRLETVKLIAEKFSINPESIKIKGINGKFGSRVFKGEAFIYKSEEDKEKIEMKKKKDDKLKEDLKPKEEPKEEAQEEVKPESTEDKTEEVKEEENKEEEKSE